MFSWKSCRAGSVATQVLGGTLLCVAYLKFSVVAEPVNVFFRVSYLTGKLLVDKLLTVCEGTLAAARLARSFCQIVYEDSVVFAKDATEQFMLAVLLLKQCFLFLEEGLEAACEFGMSVLDLVAAVAGGAASFLGLLIGAVASAKQGLRRLGSATWESVTSFPESVVQSVLATKDFVRNTAADMVNSLFAVAGDAFAGLGKLYLFVFDVPFDSVCGLLVCAVSLLLFCIKFREICLIASSTLMKLYRCAVTLCVSLWTGRFLEGRSERQQPGQGPEEDERLCVVCQYQLKEIIIFPCKHLCLCTECSNKLTKAGHSCPICRADITGTLRVYV